MLRIFKHYELNLRQLPGVAPRKLSLSSYPGESPVSVNGWGETVLRPWHAPRGDSTSTQMGYGFTHKSPHGHRRRTRAHHATPHHRPTGELFSDDDLYMTEAGLVVLETTNHVYYTNVFRVRLWTGRLGKLTPGFMS